MTRDELKSTVKSKIDELTPFDGGLALITSDVNLQNNPVELYIEQFIDQSARETLLEAPAHVLPLTVLSGLVFDLTNKKVTIPQPADFLRMGIVKFASWERPVYTVTYPGNPEYNKQLNTYLRSGHSRPKVIWMNISGAPVFICYGVESLTGADARYTAETVAENMPEILYEAMTWHCAFQVLEVFDREKLSQMAMGRYTKSLSILS
jgi:hypothetical protein